MKAVITTPFEDRYRALTPVIEQVFNLDAVLAASIGLSWATLPAEQKSMLAAAFRRYTISSYATSFQQATTARVSRSLPQCAFSPMAR